MDTKDITIHTPKTDITPIESTKELLLSVTEREIIEQLSQGQTKKQVSMRLGLPMAEINRFLRKEDVRDFLGEIIQARNKAMQLLLPNLLEQIIESKMEMLVAEDKQLGEMTRKDLPDLIQMLSTILNNQDKVEAKAEGDADPLTRIYQQLNINLSVGK